MHSNDDNPCVIMLHCCNTGQGKSSFAQQLSASGALVIAPSDECNISVNHQNKESVNNGGVWNVFLNGEKLVSLKGDESNTKRILNFLKDKTPETVYQYFKTKYAKNDE